MADNKTLTAIYDLGYYAPTFNIFEFLANARTWQKDNNFDAIRLVILKRKLRDSLIIQPQDFSGYEFRINDIVVGAANLFAIENLDITDDLNRIDTIAKDNPQAIFPPNWQSKLSPDALQGQRYYLQKFIRDNLQSGEVLPSIQIPPFAFTKFRSILAKYPKPWISITIRRAKHLPLKNSNLDCWQIVGDHFRNIGGSVFLIPDIESIEETPSSESIAFMAVSNLLYRATLYDACDLNFAVANGSTAPLWFNSSAVYLLAKFATEGTNTSIEHNRELLGINQGDALWNKVPWQQALWSNDDNPEEIISEGEKLLALCAEITAEIKDYPILLDPWGKPDGTISELWRRIDSNLPISDIKNQIRHYLATGLSDIVEECHFSAKSLIMDATYFLEISQYEDALDAAKKAIKLDGRYIQPYVIAAKCYAALGNDIHAKKFMQTAQSLTL